MKPLDLREDFAAISDLVAERVEAFDPADNPGPGEANQVSRIDLGFGLYQSGWVCLVFDTRPDAEPDGEWNEFIEDTALERPHWAEACEALETDPLVLILPDGTSQEIAAGDAGSLANALGDMLRGVLLRARDLGRLAALPKTSACELGVEEQDGSYGWPDYERRGEENRVNPAE